MTNRGHILVCFAVKEEARHFVIPPAAGQGTTVRVLVTGMGQSNASDSIKRELASHSCSLVLTCGFAGGLNPDLAFGTVVYSADEQTALSPLLTSLSAVPARFHCADRVAVTAAEKHALRETTGADAVEMESGIIRSACLQRGVPSATIRVILDAAGEDLPLDFNALMTADQKINFPKLIWSVVTHPSKIPKLLKLQRQSDMAAQRLAEILHRLLTPQSGGS